MFLVKDELIFYEDIIKYNNFYEFGIGKDDFFCNSKDFKVDLWCVEIEGVVKWLGKYILEDIFKFYLFEDCVYWFWCVEVWFMVVFWVGFFLVDLIKWFEFIFKVKYVCFEILVDFDCFFV